MLLAKKVHLLTLSVLLTIFLQPGLLKHAHAGFSAELTLPDIVSQDTDLLERYWAWLLRQTNAPYDTPFPEFSVEPMQRNIRMQLLHPTLQDKTQSWRVAISPHSIRRAERGENLLVLSEIGHELVHHILLLKEHNWQYTRTFYRPPEHSHCDKEFQYLVHGVGQIIWSAYHSADLLRAVDQMNRKACRSSW